MQLKLSFQLELSPAASRPRGRCLSVPLTLRSRTGPGAATAAGPGPAPQAAAATARHSSYESTREFETASQATPQGPGTARQGSSHAGVTVAACGSRARLADAVGALFAPGPIMMCGHVTRAAGGPGAAADARCCERLGRFKLT